MKKLFRRIFAAASLAILAVSMNACSGDDNVVVVKPAAPTGVVAVFDSMTSATVTWSPVASAASYNVYYSTNPDFTLTTPGISKISGITTIPHHFTDAALTDNTPYYFVVTTVNSAGTESLASLKVSATHASFTQADLTGPWYITVFRTGVGAPPSDLGWLRMRVTLDGAGSATINTYEQSDGVTTIPAGALTFTIDANGIVTQGGDFGGLASHNVMSSNKQLIVGTNTISATVQEIRIFQKGDALVTFSDADLAGKSFAFHQLSSGAEIGWVRGEGSIDASRVVSITSIFDSATWPAPGTPPAPDTLSIDPATGIVTSLNEPNFQGMMTLDKKMIIGTTRDDLSTIFNLRVIQGTGQTFTMGDLAGAYNFSSLFDGSSALWQYGTVTINSSGVTDFLSYLDSTGSSTIPASVTISMTAAGTITNAADPTNHGTMSFNKDLFVSTFTAGAVGSEIYGLSFAVK